MEKALDNIPRQQSATLPTQTLEQHPGHHSGLRPGEEFHREGLEGGWKNEAVHRGTKFQPAGGNSSLHARQ
eukprot:3563053-Rhodomonas_salina.1